MVRTYQVLMGHATTASAPCHRQGGEWRRCCQASHAQHGRDQNKRVKSCLLYPSDILIPGLDHDRSYVTGGRLRHTWARRSRIGLILCLPLHNTAARPANVNVCPALQEDRMQPNSCCSFQWLCYARDGSPLACDVSIFAYCIWG